MSGVRTADKTLLFPNTHFPARHPVSNDVGTVKAFRATHHRWAPGDFEVAPFRSSRKVLTLVDRCDSAPKGALNLAPRTARLKLFCFRTSVTDRSHDIRYTLKLIFCYWAGRGSGSRLCWRATCQEYSTDSSNRCVTRGDLRVPVRLCDHRGIDRHAYKNSRPHSRPARRFPNPPLALGCGERRSAIDVRPR